MSETAATPGPVARLTASRSGQRTLADRLLVAVIHLGMVAFALSIVYPFWYLLVDSFNTPEASILDRVKLWPRDMTLENYGKVFDSGIIGTAYLNSLYKAIVGTGSILLVSFIAAFGLADRTLPGIKIITFFMIFTMFFSGGLMPTYLWYKQIGLLNSRLVWFLPALANAFYIIIMRNFFREIPAELTESATIDGATLTDVLFRIVVPLSRAGRRDGGPVGGGGALERLVLSVDIHAREGQDRPAGAASPRPGGEPDLGARTVRGARGAQHHRGDRQGGPSVHFHRTHHRRLPVHPALLRERHHAGSGKGMSGKGMTAMWSGPNHGYATPGSGCRHPARGNPYSRGGT